MNHPYLDPSFLVSWSRLTPEAIRPDITEAISRAKENIRTICDQPLESLTYESTFGALEKASEDLHLGWGRIMHLDSVNDEPAQREGNAAGSGGFLLLRAVEPAPVDGAESRGLL